MSARKAATKTKTDKTLPEQASPERASNGAAKPSVKDIATAARPALAAVPAAPPPIMGGSSDDATRLAKTIETELLNGQSALSPEALQALVGAVCKLYSAQVEAGCQHLPLANRMAVTSTDVMTMASGLLKAADLAVFELAMWQSWTAR